MIAVKTTTKWSMITICNYDSYQSLRTSKEHQKNNRGTSKEHIQPLEPLEPLGGDTPKPKSYKVWTKEDFINEIATFKDFYPKDLLNEFYKKWSEPNAAGRMKFQLEKTWETGRRLESWQKKEEQWSKK